jgi:hypothetical protein
MWLRTLHNNVYTALKVKLNKKYGTTYPNMEIAKYYTSDSTPSFPHVQILMLESPEQGQTFDKSSINASLVTFQISVSSNKDEYTCQTISDYIADIMTGNYFTMVCQPVPDYDSDNNVFRYVARYRAMIGVNNTISFN